MRWSFLLIVQPYLLGAGAAAETRFSFGISILVGHWLLPRYNRYIALVYAFSSDDKTLASTGSGSDEHIIWLWDLPDGRERAGIIGDTVAVHTLAFFRGQQGTCEWRRGCNDLLMGSRYR